MEILTEFDELQAALAKVNMDESVLPYVNGRLVANSEAFNKTQKILNCPEMISAHKYLYNLDMDQLTEEDVGKIDQLYKLGCDRGFIVDDLTKWDDEDGEEAKEEDVVAAEVPAEAQPKNTLFKAKIPCWTVIYSATKDGDIKTGEAYSNAVSINAAKADVNAKLAQCGYDNITILAIENCTDVPKAPFAPTVAGQASSIDMNEADEDNAGTDDSSDDSSDTSDDTSDDSSEDASNEDESDDSSEDSADEDSDDENSSDDDSSSDDDDDDDDSDDSSDKASDEDSDDGNESGEDNSDEDSGEDEEDSDKDSDEDSDEDSDDEDSSDDDNESDELDPNEKAELRDLYRKTFKNTLIKCKFDTSFNDLTLEQKVKFFTELSKAWKKDNEPNEFMTDKEVEQLNNVVAQKSVDTDDEDTDNDESDDE